MKLLHTSDWHIGRSLYGRKRYEEFSAFLDWLAQTVDETQADVLLVAGDIFDTTTPSNRAQELYYGFLCRIAASSCRHVVITAGNHDSPSFLDAPKDLLKALHVHVIGTAAAHIEDEVIVLRAPGAAENCADAIVCAVPYLRDRDLRTVEAGESVEDKDAKLIRGLAEHYAVAADIAREKKSRYGTVPIIAMGHLFTAGGKTLDGDGVRELYVGSLAHVGSDIFPACFDYVALGHLHVPQVVGGLECIRYSGSPLPMGFGEAAQQKQVVLVEFDDARPGAAPTVSTIPVPRFQELVSISGDISQIEHRIAKLRGQGSSAWLEIEYTGVDIASNLRELIDSAIDGSDLEVLRIQNRRIVDRVIGRMDDEILEELDPREVFERCLDVHQVTDEERPELIHAYHEILRSLQEDDVMAQ